MSGKLINELDFEQKLSAHDTSREFSTNYLISVLVQLFKLFYNLDTSSTSAFSSLSINKACEDQTLVQGTLIKETWHFIGICPNDPTFYHLCLRCENHGLQQTKVPRPFEAGQARPTRLAGLSQAWPGLVWPSPGLA